MSFTSTEPFCVRLVRLIMIGIKLCLLPARRGHCRKLEALGAKINQRLQPGGVRWHRRDIVEQGRKSCCTRGRNARPLGCV